MNRLHKKNPILFAVLWIVIYVVGLSMADNASSTLGIEKSVTLPLALVLSLVLYSWIARQNLKEYYGLCPSAVPSGQLLWYFPLGMLASVNLWFGVTMNLSVPETVLYVASMFCVGFLEEVIFRGLLFKAMVPLGLKTAVAVSSLTFGMGHLVNLINGSGADLFSSLMQVVYAFAAGFLFTILFLRTGSLWACILTHGVFNALSAFANEAARTTGRDIFSAVALTVIALGYAAYILKVTESRTCKTAENRP